MAFCAWASARLRRSISLPTEEQWKRAARGTDGRAYPWGEEYHPGYANINESALSAGPTDLGRTTAVGLYPPGSSPSGVLDLAGNVWEWCLNEYDEPEDTSAAGEADRVLRGGSWVNYPGLARSAFRSRDYPNNRYFGIGFRVLCSSPIGEH
jgi:formylglycine-generating enzyme required for sulfatase activity